MVRVSTYLSFHLTNHVHDLQKLVILGTGWGGYSVLKNVDKRKFDVVVVSPRNHFLFTPLLASTTVGTLEFRSIIEPVRNYGFRDEHHFHLSKAIHLDMPNQALRCQSELDATMIYNISYDKLVVAVGAVANSFGIPGVEEHAFYLKEVSDARKIRDRILLNFELATQPGITAEEKRRLLHVVIVGGGPTGVEFGAEFYDFLKQDVSRLYKDEQRMVKVTLIEAQQILSSFDSNLRKYAEKKMQQRQQMHILQDNVIEVKEDSLTLKSGKSIPCGIVVWSAGVAARPFVKNMNFQKNHQGQLLVDDFLRIVDEPNSNVYALGDCAQFYKDSLPCTAQVAEKQGRYLGRALSQDDPKPFIFKSSGMLAYIGDYKALTDLPLAKTQGFGSWLLWRSAYTTKLGSWRLRMQVPLDWMKTYFFGRDTSRF